jgi:hypothetical protein
MLEKTRNTVSRNYNLLSMQHLSIFRRVPVASKQVPVSHLRVLMSRQAVPVRTQQVPMRYELTREAGKTAGLDNRPGRAYPVIGI